MTGAFGLTERLTAWTYRRQGLGRAAPGAMQALDEVVGVYSSHPTAPLALLARCASLDAAGFSEIEQRRDALRIPAMRGSIFLVPAATGPRIAAATRVPIERLARRLQYAGLDADAYARLKPRVLELLREPLGADELQKALKTDANLLTAVRMMSHEGLTLRLGTSLRTDNLRYVATEAWLGHPLEEADPTTSRAWLAEAYLGAYGPARVADFAWWSGVTRGQATAALSGPRLVDVGDGLLMPADERDDFEALEPGGAETIAVLPKWDAYTMGYAPDGRQRLIDDQHLGKAFSGGANTPYGVTSGDGLPLVLRGGRAVASWSHRFQGARMVVKVAPFESGTLPRTAYERGFGEVAQLLGAASLDVSEAAGP